MMDLRPHQQKAVEMLRASIFNGKHRPVLAAPCSFGKTITAAHILASASAKGKRGIFICDRIKLVQQALSEFDEHGLDVGVIQGIHERTNPFATIQIASIQTLARRMDSWGGMPEFDIAIVDECHTHYESLTKLMNAYNAVPFIGLSATPFSKGLGRHYNNLIVPITTQDLLDQGFLTPIHYYGGAKADLTGIRKKAISTGGSDYDPDQLGDAYQDDKLCGDIIANWKKWADGRQTIAFSPSIKHSKYMVDMFNEAGIPAEHIDGYMEPEERQWLYDAHDAGEFLILSCSRLLNTGYDAPQVSALIDCFPTSSPISYCQRAGRIFRLSEGKEFSVYLDHSGNVARHGFAEHIVPDSLDDGEVRFTETRQIKKDKETKIQDCPECYQQMAGLRCNACGYEIPMRERLVSDDAILERMSAQTKSNRIYSAERKSEWLGELYYYAQTRGYSEGWAAHKYKSKFGVWPNKIKATLANHVSEEVSNWIRRENIRYSFIRDKAQNANDNSRASA